MLRSLRLNKFFKRTLPFTLNPQESRSDRAICLQKSWQGAQRRCRETGGEGRLVKEGKGGEGKGGGEGAPGHKETGR